MFLCIQRSGWDSIPEPKPLVRVRKASCFVTTRSAGKCPDFSSPIIASVITETAEKSPDVSPQCAAAADMAERWQDVFLEAAKYLRVSERSEEDEMMKMIHFSFHNQKHGLACEWRWWWRWWWWSVNKKPLCVLDCLLDKRWNLKTSLWWF